MAVGLRAGASVALTSSGLRGGGETFAPDIGVPGLVVASVGC